MESSSSTGAKKNQLHYFQRFARRIILSNDERRINVAWIVIKAADTDVAVYVQVQVSSRMFASESVTHARSARFFPGRLSHCVLINATRAKGHRGLPFSEANDPQQSGQKSPTRNWTRFREQARDLARHFSPIIASFSIPRSGFDTVLSVDPCHCTVVVKSFWVTC